MSKMRVLSAIVLLLILACNSPEFTSGKMYVNENNLEKAEEQFKLALQVEPNNALIPYRLAVDVYAPQKRLHPIS